MAVRWKYLYSSSVGRHIIAIIPIWQYFSWFYVLRSERNIESEHLLDEVVNLWIFTVGLTLIGCQPHTSSVWPWSGTPKVRLYGTIISGLRHSPPRMKNQCGSMRKKTLEVKKWSLLWVQVTCHVWLAWFTNNLKRKSFMTVEKKSC